MTANWTAWRVRMAAAAGAVALAGGCLACVSAPASAAPRVKPASAWGTAKEVHGTAALNQGGNAALFSVSCASAGNCSAGGYYTDSSGDQQAFVVAETGGTWGTAQEVPGTAALNTGDSWVTSVSCASAGNCSAGGYYTDSSGDQQAFVVAETGGTWGTAQEVPGTAALNTGNAEIKSVSCASAGNCGAGGYYTTSAGFQAFVVSETGGTWGTAEEVPGTAALNKGGFAQIQSVSCASAGSCSAGGEYTGAFGVHTGNSDHQQAFVVNETGGTWRTAKEVPGTAALNSKGVAAVYSVSCASAGTCSAGGIVTGAAGNEPFVVGETKGTWGTAEKVPGIGALNHGYGSTEQVSCTSAGTCSAGGFYSDGPAENDTQPFVAGETGGTWGTAQEVPGITALGAEGADAGVVSCASAGTCSAGGYYTDNSGATQVFVVAEAKGTWGTAREVPGTAALNKGGNASLNAISCAPAGTCSAGGQYVDGSGHTQAYVVSQTGTG